MLRSLNVTKLFGWSVVSVVIAVVLGYGAASGSQPAPAGQAPSIGMAEPALDACRPTSTTMGLSLMQEPDGGACWADAAGMGGTAPERGRPKHGYCRCGCGIRCATSADCGGAPCQAFVTCC